jgi:hypothetical protein
LRERLDDLETRILRSMAERDDTALQPPIFNGPTLPLVPS